MVKQLSTTNSDAASTTKQDVSPFVQRGFTID